MCFTTKQRNTDVSFTPTARSLSRERRRARFARSAVFEEFGGRQARALDYDKFHDRKPSEKPWEPPAGIDALLVLAE